MRHPVLLPAMAALCAVPTAQAFEIASDAWNLSIEPRIQTRIEFASASDAAGDDFDVWEGRSTENPQSVNFQVRRARLYFKGKHEDGWKFELTVRADKIGIEDDNGGTDVEMYYAFAGREFKSDDITHYVQFGRAKHTSVIAELDSSSKLLFPNGRLAAEYAGPNSVGLDYHLSHPVFGLSVGIADEVEGGSGFSENNDFLFYVRAESGLKEEWTLPKRKESYLGEEGFGHLAGIGVDFKTDGSDAPDGVEDDDVTTITLDYLVHYDQITGLFELVQQSRGDAFGDTSGIIVNAQAGFAFPQDDGQVFEAAARLQFVDNDDDNDDEMGVLVQEGGASGVYIDLGGNWYIDGHDNKFQAGVQFYTPEEGDGDATVFRLAHNLEF